MLKRRISTPLFEKLLCNALYNPWVYTNKQKAKSFNNEFENRIKALDKEAISLSVLETRSRLCNDNYTKEYLSKVYDPFLNGSYRKTIYKNLSPSTLKKTLIENTTDKFEINRIHGILLSDVDYQEFEQKKNKFDSKFVRESEFPNLNPKVPSLFSEGRIDSKKGTKYFKYLLTKIVTDPHGRKISRNLIRIKEISKEIPRWSYRLITDLEQQSGEYQEDVPVDHQIRSRNSKRVVIFTANTASSYSNIMDTNMPDQLDEVALIRYSQQPDFRRDIIKGSMRVQRRKIVISELFQANAHSPLFFERLQKSPLFSFDISGFSKVIFRNWVSKGETFKMVEYTKEQTKREEKKEKNKRKEKVRIGIAEAWDSIQLAQVIRGCMLITQSIFRKSILLPLLIITKNIGRILLFQPPEWAEDFQEWNREVHLKCTYNGVPLSETEFPKSWLTDGIQIKILFPFCLKPWRKSKSRSFQKDLMKKEKDDFCFLTIWGMEADLPFGSPRKRPSFFKPILKELKKQIEKGKKKYFRVLTVFKEKTKLPGNVSKELKKWVIGGVFFIKKITKELSKVNPILLFRLRKVYKSTELKDEKDFTTSNPIINESFSQIAPSSRTNSPLIEKKTKDLADKTSKIRNKIERISKEKKKVTTRINNLSPKKTNYNAKRLEKCKILKRRNVRLICKLPSFLKIFIEKTYTDTFLFIINIPRINTEFFLKLTKKTVDKSIYNNERKQTKINTKKKTPIAFILAIKKPLDKISNIKIKENSHIFYDLSYMSQAYVFYKLSQLKISNSLRPAVQYQRIPPFIKPKIKDSFERERMVNSKLANKKFPGYEMNQWKNWLKGHFQYHLSQIRWSRLIPEKRRTRVGQRCIAKKENLSKWDSYEKNLLVGSKKQSEVDLLSNEKDNFRKYYRYNLLSYKFLNYENKTECFFYRPPFEGNKNQEIYYTYNRAKKALFDIRRNIPIPNDLGQVDIPYMEKPTNRKYFDWKYFDFYLRQKVDIEAWIIIDTNRYQNDQIHTKNSQIIYKKDIFYLMIPETNSLNSHKGFFGWMGMNEKMLKRPIPNLEFWLFPEFVLLYKAYKMKPWFIPSKFLLLSLNNNNSSKNKKINLLIASNKKYRNEEEKEPISQEDHKYTLSQQKDIEENYASSDMQKVENKKQYKRNTEAELDFFLKRYLLFQLRWGATLNQRMIDNSKVYCLLLRLIDPRKITISSIQKRELSLDIMLIQRNLTLSELMKKGVLIVEPLRLSGKKDGQFIMYQTIGISLLHKSKYQINQKYQEQRYVSKKNFDETILSRISENNFGLLVPENILSFKRRRKVRILICFSSKNRNFIERNPLFWNEKNVANSSRVSPNNNHLDREKNKLMKLKLFLWPNYRLEDLACMNRYCFNTNNGSRFNMLRIYLYPRLKFCE
uniref:hypothetical chloroplast RF1 n=1 Tax=Dracocephalum cuspidatum TaxID=1439902 RepID=UPI002551FEA6|nr:hypothetical chloroplast RF1 [Dracocephalum cuspidatum]WEV87787.1 hypothetical chloroplast RF1 [Dracocephalum cuspidatum]